MMEHATSSVVTDGSLEMSEGNSFHLHVLYSRFHESGIHVLAAFRNQMTDGSWRCDEVASTVKRVIPIYLLPSIGRDRKK